jgi:hypothetical protein
VKTPPNAASGAQTRAEGLDRSGRGYTKVRHNIAQKPDGHGSSIPSVLGPMVTDRKKRSLQLYLALLTYWPWVKNLPAPIPAAGWARSLQTDKGRKWTPTNVSEAWADLKARGLVETKRLSRGLVVEPRREDGDAAYTDPGEVRANHDESYFTLPPEFWTDEWFEELSMPALAMLLIISSKTSKDPETWLTNEDAAKWFGLSPRSVEGGIKDLKDAGLLSERVEWIPAGFSALGATKRHWYSLNGPFSTAARHAMQDAARVERAARVAPPKPKRAKTTAKKKAATKAASREATKATPNKRVGKLLKSSTNRSAGSS